MIHLSTTHNLTLPNDVGRVFWCSDDKSINIGDFEDNLISVYGIGIEHIVLLSRNVFCSSNKPDLSRLSKYELKALQELKEYFTTLQFPQHNIEEVQA